MYEYECDCLWQECYYAQNEYENGNENEPKFVLHYDGSNCTVQKFSCNGQLAAE